MTIDKAYVICLCYRYCSACVSFHCIRHFNLTVQF